MKTKKTFGFLSDDLETIARAIEVLFAIELQARESFYFGGDYYSYDSEEGLDIFIHTNVDLVDKEPVKLEFGEYGILMYITTLKLEQDLENILTNFGESIKLLRIKDE